MVLRVSIPIHVFTGRHRPNKVVGSGDKKLSGRNISFAVCDHKYPAMETTDILKTKSHLGN